MRIVKKSAIIAGLSLLMLAIPILTTSAQTNAWGVKMPADAAPLDQQFIRLLQYEGTTADFAVSVYKRGGTSNASLLSTPFVRINKNFELLPNGALSYDASKDGKTWTFHMDPALK
jgi:ABC-type transport system substrate-binding protein